MSVQPNYSLFIHPKDLIELRGDIWCDDPVSAKMRVQKKQFDIGISYRGSHIRKFTKKSYQIYFNKPYSYFGAKEVHLNAEYNDPSLIRNKLSLDFFESIGTLSPRSEHVSLTINGVYQGVYLQLESVDDQFLKKRGLPKTSSIFYAENDDANFSLVSPIDKELKQSFSSGYYEKYGNDEDIQTLEDFIYKVNTISRSDFEREIVKLVDIDKYLRWLVGVVCTQNFDGFIHNYALLRNGDTGLFEIIPWDYDATFGRDVHGEIMEYNYIPIKGYNTLTARILDVSSFRSYYKKLLENILNEQFTVSYMQPTINLLYKKIRPYVLKDPYVKENIQQFDLEPEVIVNYINNRNLYLRKHLKDLE
jgi:spore coat protein H